MLTLMRGHFQEIAEQDRRLAQGAHQNAWHELQNALMRHAELLLDQSTLCHAALLTAKEKVLKEKSGEKDRPRLGGLEFRPPNVRYPALCPPRLCRPTLLGTLTSTSVFMEDLDDRSQQDYTAALLVFEKVDELERTCSTLQDVASQFPNGIQVFFESTKYP